jgi:polyhydroxybutyrate depolymerase
MRRTIRRTTIARFVLALGLTAGCAASEDHGNTGSAGSEGGGGAGGDSASGIAGSGSGAAGRGGAAGSVAGSGGGLSAGSGGAGGPGGGAAGSSGGVAGAAGGAAGSAGGAAGTGGGVGQAGRGGGGGGGRGGGAAGGTGGGSAGTGGSGAGGAGGSTPAVPSAGCARMAGRPANGTVMVSNSHIFMFPTSYDGTTPMQVLVGFHANGNPITQIRDLTNGSRLEASFVRVFPKSAGAGWVVNTDTARFNTVFTELTTNYCVDTSRVFATGHSSGAQMVVQMLCAGDRRFKAAAPVAASKYCNSFAAIPVMYIQGMMDAQRGNGNGVDVVNVFRTSNTCGTASDPYSVPTCMSTFDRMTVTPGCVSYQGCNVPTIWCSHNDNGYNNTDGRQHGWPCFASNAMADFFLGLR